MNKYRQIFKKTPIVDWCEIMSESIKNPSDFLIKAASWFVKSKFPELAQPCPISKVSLDKRNIIFDGMIMSMAPSGNYRTIILLTTKNNDVIFQFVMVMEIM